MSTPTKYRIFDRKQHRCVYSDEFGKGNAAISAFFNYIETNSCHCYDRELMQYTGLKDSTRWEKLSKAEQDEWISQGRGRFYDPWNGREIYEGDVIESFSGYSVTTEIVNEKLFGQLFLRSLEPCRTVDVFVIGNIYENPNLWSLFSSDA